MNALRVAGAAFGLWLAGAAPALAQPEAAMQPPMNDFTQAFYRCDGGLAFMISYDSERPTTADMMTNDDGRHYALKRTTAPSGVQFSGGGARFWTDGKTVVVEGTKSAFKNCKIKPG
ncbi:MliC family protein [Phenylobacterium sp.]|uniref:MliC family protein n=1 Tax=Phenylobacterium sp. TaxID=1871053 RepID=UPI00286A6A43|nr:MliC family protein [Phenylobacterium sp.]